MTLSESEARPGTPAEIARKLFELLNAHDLEGLAPYQHPDVVDDFVAIGEYAGAQRVREFFADLFRAFPDFKIEVQRITSSGNVAVVQWKSRGTFSGASFLGLAPNGATVEIRGIDVMEFEGGRLRHNTIYYDGAAFARAVGVLPKQGSGVERALFGAFNAVTRLRSVSKRNGGTARER